MDPLLILIAFLLGMSLETIWTTYLAKFSMIKNLGKRSGERLVSDSAGQYSSSGRLICEHCGMAFQHGEPVHCWPSYYYGPHALLRKSLGEQIKEAYCTDCWTHLELRNTHFYARDYSMQAYVEGLDRHLLSNALRLWEQGMIVSGSSSVR